MRGSTKQSNSSAAAASVVPLMRYRDCAAAIDWLGRAFALDRHFVVGSDDGKVAYAQLTYGTGMIMLGPVGDTGLDSHLKQPDEVGGSATQSCYLAVDDIDAHYVRARAAGAEIVLDLKEAEFGSRGYSCRDLEGHIWNFGSYDPWRGKRQPDVSAIRASKPARRGIMREVVVLGLCASALVVTLATLRRDWLPPIANAWPPAWSSTETEIENLTQQLDQSQAARTAAENEAASTRHSLAQSEAARVTAEQKLSEAKLDVERERAARGSAEQGASAAVDKIASDVRSELQSERSARETAEAGLAQERSAREAAERAAEDLKGRLSIETKAREDAEALAKKSKDQLSRLEEAPKPDDSSTVMTGTATNGPVETKVAAVDTDETAQPSATLETTSASVAATPPVAASTPITLAKRATYHKSRSMAKVRAWRQREDRAERRRQEALAKAKAKAKLQANTTKPYKPAAPAVNKPAKSEGPYLNIL